MSFLYPDEYYPWGEDDDPTENEWREWESIEEQDRREESEHGYE